MIGLSIIFKCPGWGQSTVVVGPSVSLQRRGPKSDFGNFDLRVLVLTNQRTIWLEIFKISIPHLHLSYTIESNTKGGRCVKLWFLHEKRYFCNRKFFLRVFKIRQTTLKNIRGKKTQKVFQNFYVRSLYLIKFRKRKYSHVRKSALSEKDDRLKTTPRVKTWCIFLKDNLFCPLPLVHF